MALSFDDAVALVQAELDSELGANTVPIEKRREDLSRSSVKRRVVMYWPNGRLLGSNRRGPVENTAGTNAAKALHDNAANIVAYVSDESFEAAEELWKAVCRAVYHGLLSASEPGDYDVQSQDAERTGAMLGRHEFIQRFVWQLVINDRPLGLAVVKTVSGTCDFE